MNAHFKKFTACQWEGLIHEWKQAFLAPPLPLMSLNNSRFCSPHNSSAACQRQRSTPENTSSSLVFGAHLRNSNPPPWLLHVCYSSIQNRSSRYKVCITLEWEFLPVGAVEVLLGMVALRSMESPTHFHHPPHSLLQAN